MLTDTYLDMGTTGPAPFERVGPTVVATPTFAKASSELGLWFNGFRPDERRTRAIAALDKVDFSKQAVVAVAVRGSCFEAIRVTRIVRESGVLRVFAEQYDVTAPRPPASPSPACMAITFYNVHIVVVPRWAVSDNQYVVANVRYADPRTVEMGRGLGGWRIGMTYRQGSNLLRSEPYPQNLSPGCFGSPQTAGRIDYYPDLRVAWTNGVLSNVATRVIGHRSEAGFAIGTADFETVRTRFPKARTFRGSLAGTPYWRSRYALGRSLIIVTRNTAWEAWVSTHYWFDRQGTLVALETLAGGC